MPRSSDSRLLIQDILTEDPTRTRTVFGKIHHSSGFGLQLSPKKPEKLKFHFKSTTQKVNIQETRDQDFLIRKSTTQRTLEYCRTLHTQTRTKGNKLTAKATNLNGNYGVRATCCFIR